MITSLRLAFVLATALVVTGCTASPGDQPPTSTPAPDGDIASQPVGDEFNAAWLDDGRMFAIVTQGSSSCAPVVGEVTADGQQVSVELIDPPSDDGVNACTDDLTARASVGMIPSGVDPTSDVELIVTAGDVTADVELDGNPALTGIPGEKSAYEASAGWFDEEGIVLLTWGSSGCPPIVESVDVQGAGATVTFKAEDRLCTMDLGPRATILSVGEGIDDDTEFVLTLVGDNLDGTVNVSR